MSGPTYTYTLGVPQATNPMNGTAPVIRENFQAINELIAVNHVGFNTSDAGKHNFISMPNTTAPGTTATEIAMFTQVTGSPNPCEIFIQYPNNGATGTVLEISNQPIPSGYIGTSGGTASQGWCTFPSGILFRWGTFSIQGLKSTTITFTAGPAVVLQPYCGALSPTSSGDPISLSIQINGTFSNSTTFSPTYYGAASTSVTTSFNYLFMGL